MLFNISTKCANKTSDNNCSLIPRRVQKSCVLTCRAVQ